MKKLFALFALFLITAGLPAIAKEAATSGRTIREVARERAGLPEEELDRLLDPERMTEPGLGGSPSSG